MHGGRRTGTGRPRGAKRKITEQILRTRQTVADIDMTIAAERPIQVVSNFDQHH